MGLMCEIQRIHQRNSVNNDHFQDGTVICFYFISFTDLIVQFQDVSIWFN